VSKIIRKKAALPTCHPRGCKWIHQILTLIHGSLDPQNGISISSAIFAWHICVTNTPTDRPHYM